MRRLVALAAVGLALAGCGGAGEELQSDPDASPGAAAAAPASPSAAPAVGQSDVAQAPSEAASPAGSAPSSAARTGADPVSSSVDEEVDGATLWVTRSAGSELLLSTQVEAGATVVQVLDGAAEIETRYGGRYVTSIAGVKENTDRQEDWFFLVNGIEPDVGAAEIKVADGDVIWWDHRSWVDGGAVHPAATVGAFPRPFHRGWKGAIRPVEVIAPPELSDSAAAMRDYLDAAPPDEPDAEPHRFVLEVRDGMSGAELSASMGNKNGSAVTFVLAGTEDAIRATVATLIERPESIAHHYSATFDSAGQVIDG